jgi:hypothetical protein
VVFLANPDDDASLNQPVTAPVIGIQRRNPDKLGIPGYDSPHDLLVDTVDVNPIFIQPYRDAAYPASRALVDEWHTMTYALQLSADNWIVAVLTVPPGADLLELDEMIMQPVVNSIRVLDTLDRTVTPTAIPSATATATSSIRPTATYTPTNSPTQTGPLSTPTPTYTPT